MVLDGTLKIYVSLTLKVSLNRFKLLYLTTFKILFS